MDRRDKVAESLKLIVDSCSNDPNAQSLLSKEMDGFLDLFTAFAKGRGGFIDWSKIQPPPAGKILFPYSDLTNLNDKQKIKELLSKLCVVKLNGGLGTTMGCTGPKSVIEVTRDYTFLDLTVLQIEKLNREFGVDVPLVLMNSFNTHDETQKVISKYKNTIRIYTFNQSCYPRIYKENYLPMPTSYKDKKSYWYPPGHGDLYSAFVNSGLLSTLIKQGIEYSFVSNIDNLGATVDVNILNHMHTTKGEYVMELTEKTRADIKGGTLIDYEGKARLLEIAQVHPNHVEEFKSIKKFKIFNTNNMWMNLKAVDRLVRENAFSDMDVIINGKTIDGKGVIQLERAAGAAMQYFSGAIGVVVPRSRFLPVKSTSDLFLLQSNLFTFNKDEGSLILNPIRAASFSTAPLVKLGDHFTKVSDYMERFGNIPDILELDHLTVSGDVTFGSNVSLKGTVIIVANHGARIDIPAGSTIENKVVSGNLRILDH